MRLVNTIKALGLKPRGFILPTISPDNWQKQLIPYEYINPKVMDQISLLIAPIILSMITVWISLPVFSRYSRKKLAGNIPSNRTALRTVRTPISGGITFIWPILFMLVLPLKLPIVLLLSLLAIIALGYADERHHSGPFVKLFVLGLITLGMFFSGINSNALETILGLEDPSFAFSLLFTFFLIMGQINAFNLIDRIDGLVGGIGLINTSVFGLLFYWNGDTGFAVLNFSVGAAIFAFLCFNVHPAKLLMGETGVFLIGLLTAISFLQILNYEDPLSSTLAFACILFPSLDMLRFFVVRSISTHNPFNTDKNHFLHLLNRLGNNHQKASLIYFGIQLLQLIAGWQLLQAFSFGQTNFLLFTLSVSIYTIIELQFRVYRWLNRRSYRLSLRKK